LTDAYTLVPNLASEIEPPTDGTLSRTVFQDSRLKVILFGFSAGQELSEHTASSPAIMHFLRGEADVTIGLDKLTASTGTWIHMPAQLPNSIRTKTPVVMQLLLLKHPESQ
jgi:quercetin dioxygenase-like cupin family protein